MVALDLHEEAQVLMIGRKNKKKIVRDNMSGSSLGGGTIVKKRTIVRD